MADHTYKGDAAPKPMAPDLVEVKVVAATLVALLASIAVAVLNGVVADSTLLGGLPPIWQTLILLVVPPLLTFLGGYSTPSNRV